MLIFVLEMSYALCDVQVPS